MVQVSPPPFESGPLAVFFGVVDMFPLPASRSSFLPRFGAPVFFDAQEFRQPVGGFALLDAVQIGDQRNQIAALVASCEVRPCARIPVDRETARFRVGARRIRRQVFPALVFPAADAQPVGDHIEAGQCGSGDRVNECFCHGVGGQSAA